MRTEKAKMTLDLKRTRLEEAALYRRQVRETKGRVAVIKADCDQLPMELKSAVATLMDRYIERMELRADRALDAACALVVEPPPLLPRRRKRPARKSKAVRKLAALVP